MPWRCPRVEYNPSMVVNVELAYAFTVCCVRLRERMCAASARGFLALAWMVISLFSRFVILQKIATGEALAISAKTALCTTQKKNQNWCAPNEKPLRIKLRVRIRSGVKHRAILLHTSTHQNIFRKKKKKLDSQCVTKKLTLTCATSRIQIPPKKSERACAEKK